MSSVFDLNAPTLALGSLPQDRLEYLRRFLQVRSVRRFGCATGLLGAGNRLGLVYVPFALGTLRLSPVREPVD
jgi:hypothetical protein